MCYTYLYVLLLLLLLRTWSILFIAEKLHRDANGVTLLSIKNLISCILVIFDAPIYGGNDFIYVKENKKIRTQMIFQQFFNISQGEQNISNEMGK